MNVVLAARSADKLDSFANELGQAGVTALAVPTDVEDTAALEHLVAHSVGRFGTIDVLVNNAGIETYYPFEELDVGAIVQTIGVNLTAAIILTRLAMPHMLEAGRGHVVNMSSTAGKFGPAYGAAYGASKAGLVAFTETLRGEFHGTGISASVLCPGFTNDGGIYERIKQGIGKGTPPQMGATSADAVARAVIKAIRRDIPEMLINVPPMRPALVLSAIAPRLGQWCARKASARFLKKVAFSRHKVDLDDVGASVRLNGVRKKSA